MDKILKRLNNTGISLFMDRFMEQDKLQMFEDLILIGIDLILTRLKEKQRKLQKPDLKNLINQEVQKCNIHASQKVFSEDQTLITKQINSVKKQIQKINKKFSNLNTMDFANQQILQIVSPNSKNQNAQQLHFKQKQQINKNYFTKEKKKQSVTPKVTQIYPQSNNQTFQTKRIKNRPHLDDAQLKQILTYTNVDLNNSNYNHSINPNSIIKKQQKINSYNIKDNSYNNIAHNQKRKIQNSSKIYQDIKTQKSLDFLRKNRSPENNRQNSGPKYLRNVQSKIKEMINHDKVKGRNSRLNIELQFQQNFIKSKLFQNNNSGLQQNNYDNLADKKKINKTNQTIGLNNSIKFQKKIKNKNRQIDSFSPFKNQNMNGENYLYQDNKNYHKNNKKHIIKQENRDNSSSKSSQFSAFNPDRENDNGKKKVRKNQQNADKKQKSHKKHQKQQQFEEDFDFETNYKGRKNVGKISRKKQRQIYY